MQDGSTPAAACGYFMARFLVSVVHRQPTRCGQGSFHAEELELHGTLSGYRGQGADE